VSGHHLRGSPPRRTHRHRAPRRSCVAAGVVLAVALSTAACRTSDQPHASLDDSPGAPATTQLLADPGGSTLGTAVASGSDAPSTAPPTTNPNEPAVRAVIDRYWRGYLKAVSDPPDPNNPDLVAVLNGEASARVTGAIRKLKDSGQFIRAPENSAAYHEITGITFDERGIATVEECSLDDLQVVEKATGRIVNGNVTTDHFHTTLASDPQLGWFITTRTSSEESGSVGCPGH
jgi:hypothetical protein